LVIDVDATLVTARSDFKEGAEGTYKHTFGFHPLLAYLDRGTAPGEPLAGLLRPGNAAPGTTEDLVELVELALTQLPTAASGQAQPGSLACAPQDAHPPTAAVSPPNARSISRPRSPTPRDATTRPP
jgi:hypothetical protein